VSFPGLCDLPATAFKHYNYVMTVAVETHGFLLDGKWISDRKAVAIHSPYDQSLVGTAALATRADADAAIASAVRAFEVTRKLPAYERQRVLRKIAELIRGERDPLARMLALETGKPIKTARAEIDRAAFTFDVAAEEAVRSPGEYLPLDVLESTRGRWGMVRRFPLGPIAGITPFNFPFNLVGHKVAPAIAAGCSIVIKPAPQTPFSALNLARIVTAAGWPAGGLNVVPLANEDAGVLVEDERLKMLSFTGSAAVGWALGYYGGITRPLAIKVPLNFALSTVIVAGAENLAAARPGRRAVSDDRLAIRGSSLPISAAA